ncbi:MAG TPA: hypothetical protein VGD58_13495 [Herpetosiphonaceae bacterium]
MPYQNRVTPQGTLIAADARGMYTGNRGRLHAADGQITRQYEVRRWIMCRLDYPRPTHTVMAPQHYTHLFFLDEATALAAGHRPCSMCLHSRFKEFAAYWQTLHPEADGSAKPNVDTIDRRLHEERLTDARHKRTYAASLDELPDGAFILLEPQDQPLLVLGQQLLAWTPQGYTAAIARPSDRPVAVLTPPSIVAILAAGYRPALHPSAASAIGSP